MAVFLGCDLGTLGTKAAVVDEEGSIIGSAFEEVRLRYPRPGWVEQDLDEIERSAHRTIRRALVESGRAADVAAVACSAQMAGIGAITKEFTPAIHYDSWLDTRCEPEIELMSAHAERITAVAGCPPTYSHGPKILWWQRNRPEDLRRIARFVVPGAYVAGRLCGLSTEQAFVDRTYLHFSNLADTARAVWSPELIETFGVDADLLPRIVEPTDVVGEITPEAAEQTGLPEGTPVAAGAGDTAAAALGAGVVSPGLAFDVAGTASVFGICVDRFQPDRTHRTVMAMPSVVAGHYIALAFINGGGLGLRWFRDELAALGDRPGAYAELDELAASVPPGCEGLWWYPHIQGRVLPPEPQVRGGWIGLTSGHTKAHMFRAMLEGVAYEYASWARLVHHDAAPFLTEARTVGGGAASAVWNQIKADVLGVDWVTMVQQECGVLGDAAIAAAATGHVGDLAATASAWQQEKDRVAPAADRHARYREMLTGYEKFRECLAPVWSTLSRRAW